MMEQITLEELRRECEEEGKEVEFKRYGNLMLIIRLKELVR